MPVVNKDTPVRQLTPKLYEALQLAFELHGRDARKSSPVPVMAHLVNVCALVQQDGGDEEEAIAALLHDALEDKPEDITRAEIAARFGERVLDIIIVSTDTPPDYTGGEKPAWKLRKQAYLEQVRQADPGYLRVTIADKIDNARAMLADHRRLGESMWNRFNAPRQEVQWYYRQSVDAYRAAGFISPLLTDLQTLVNQLCALG